MFERLNHLPAFKWEDFQWHTHTIIASNETMLLFPTTS